MATPLPMTRVRDPHRLLWRGCWRSAPTSHRPGTTRRHRLEENLGAAKIQFSAAELRDIEAAAAQIPIEGERYSPQQQAMVGREAPLGKAGA